MKLPSLANASQGEEVKQESLFKFWQGKQLYFFNGRLQFGINLYAPFGTFAIINLLQIPFLMNTLSVSALQITFP